MKFFRVSYSKEGGNSGGFTWHTNHREALAAAKADYDQDPDEYNHHAPRRGSDRIEAIEIAPTRNGILRALVRFATHPDNG